MMTACKEFGRRQRAAAQAAGFLLAAALLAGCQTSREVAEYAPPSDYRLRHPIAIKERERAVELFIGTSRGALTGPQRASVVGFANNWRREGTGGVIIDVPAGTPNEAAANAALKEIRSLLHAAGVPPQGVIVRAYHPGDPLRLATVRLSHPAMIADAGPCGLWPSDLGPTAAPEHIQNRPYWNLGCASQRNLAAMVENPADLVQPRAEAPPYAARRSTVIEKYRKGESTATIYPNADKGAISDVAK